MGYARNRPRKRAGSESRPRRWASPTRHYTGRTTSPPPASRTRARAARYRLLGAYATALAERPVAIVTAHTEDDQAETLLMRLARGSGVDGLSSMRRRRPLLDDPDVMLARPLLGLAKRRLVATLEAAALDWIEDPSNARADFERARLREAAGELTALGLTTDKLALSAGRLLRARDALDQAADDLSARAVDVHGGIHAKIDPGAFLAAPAELRLRLLARVLAAFGGEARPARLAQVEALMEALSAPRTGSSRVAVTLGGCIVRAGARAIHVFREQGAGGLPVLTLDPGQSATWDGRFHVGLADARSLAAAGIAAPVIVRALGPSAYATLRPQFATACLPARAAAALPSFWAADRLVGVPQIEAIGLPQITAETVCTSQFVAWRPTTASRGPQILV